MNPFRENSWVELTLAFIVLVLMLLLLAYAVFPQQTEEEERLLAEYPDLRYCKMQVLSSSSHETERQMLCLGAMVEAAAEES